MRYQKQFSTISSALKYTCLLISLFFCLVACKTNLAPVEDINRPPPKLSGAHTVKPDETLYSISWRYNRDFKDLAAVNHISEPYSIQPGQVLSLAPAPQAASATSSNTRATQQAKSSLPKDVAAKNKKNTIPQQFPRTVTWNWPAVGKVQGDFKQTKGINILGSKGSPILAAASGRVVYSGSGLRGYGKLIIIKHNERLLSAYAHNETLYVKEGDWVDLGQRIASMGQSDTNTVQLHFEIRQDGKPVEPLRYLPKR